MAIKTSKGDKIFYFINYIVVTIVALATVYPMLYVVFASFSDPVEFSKVSGLLFAPAGFSTEAYKEVLTNPEIWIGYRNTLFYVIAGTLISMFMTIIAAYALSRPIVAKKPIMMMIMFTMFFGGGMIPNYLLVQSLGMNNTVFAILIPGCLSTWNMIILRSYFMSLPESLIEAAELDGANDVDIIWRIVLPLSKAALATISLFYGVGKWNEWFSSLLYLRDRNLYPLQIFLRETLIVLSSVDYENMDLTTMEPGQLLFSQIVKFATVIVSTAPIIMVYPFLQKYFAKGVMIGAVKG